MTKLSKQEKAFSWAVANGSEPADAFRENFKTGRWKSETVERKAQALMERKEVSERLKKDARDVSLVKAHEGAKGDRNIRPRLKLESQEGKSVQVSSDHSSEAVFRAAAASAFGSDDDAFTEMMVNQVISMIPQDEFDLSKINGVLSALGGIAPHDELEAMLVAQMVAVHFAAIEATRRAGVANQTFEARNMNLKHAGQLMRTYTQQMEALKRHRGKGEQKMTVEHVHVHDGGQAIVGTVNNARGAGDRLETKGQAHEQAAIAHAPVAPMWSEEPSGEAVQSASDEEREVPTARRKGNGCT